MAFLMCAPIACLMRVPAVLLLVALLFVGSSVGPERLAVVFLSFDLELSPPSAVNGSLLSYDAIGVLPRLQGFLEENDVPATFFVVGDVVEKYPLAVWSLHSAGFEIAAHGGYYHAGFRGIPLEEQERRIRRNVLLIGNLTGERPVGFRAPAHDYDNDTFAALRQLGFLYDSSIVGRGAAPGIVELPVTVAGDEALNIDYLLRFRGLEYTKLLVSAALEDARMSGRPLVIYAHPWAFARLLDYPKDYRTGPAVLSDFEKFLIWLKAEDVVFMRGVDFVSSPRFYCEPAPAPGFSL